MPIPDFTCEYVGLDYALEESIASRAAIGLITLSTDDTIEHEWHSLLNLEGVGLYDARIASPINFSSTRMLGMSRDIGAAAALIRPDQRLDVIAFGCTLASIIIGEEGVFDLIHDVRPGVSCTTPITAVKKALDCLGIRRIALLTPYGRETNEIVRDYLSGFDISVRIVGSFENCVDANISRIDRNTLGTAISRLGATNTVDAVFVSCTSLRVSGLIESIEQCIGKPVMSSNHAMAWHALRLAGITDSVPGLGRLFTV